jgi:hypothetical protein
VKQATISIKDPNKDYPVRFDVHISHRPKLGGRGDAAKPGPADVPLDPVRRQDEFKAVLADWLRRHADWRVPRVQYVSCLGKGNKYGSARLVAAANMFDILPTQALPSEIELPDEMKTALTSGRALFRALPSDTPGRGGLAKAWRGEAKILREGLCEGHR